MNFTVRSDTEIAMDTEEVYKSLVRSYAAKYPQEMTASDHLKDGKRERLWGILLGMRYFLEMTWGEQFVYFDYCEIDDEINGLVRDDVVEERKRLSA